MCITNMVFSCSLNNRKNINKSWEIKVHISLLPVFFGVKPNGLPVSFFYNSPKYLTADIIFRDTKHLWILPSFSILFMVGYWTLGLIIYFQFEPEQSCNWILVLKSFTLHQVNFKSLRTVTNCKSCENMEHTFLRKYIQLLQCCTQ